ncbi:type III secretion system inner membrane ring subunit SctD [Shewanella sp. YLB-07]|uniref:type III secretion system inner membrane ring subunit SctD n=1 Tax=Shewanella sp. YLB-07 TaxID=2601268 RepID=UPI00128BAEA4|nr:type III secretion system inner membrane ring subunit SctD [Shewanella sp. YLB-07]MPY25692.1 EscD/YscD/HrpQ family type III secretion system inner membrane ring protein [Shewanella sp. YLB-07]
MTQWKIKLLSGSHAQVELPLSAGEFIIGSDELNADIVLSDKDIDAKHVTLSVAEAITLIELPQDSQIFINDEQKQTHSSLILARGDSVRLGALCFVVGWQEDELGQASVPQAGEIKHQVANQSASSWRRSVLIGLLLSLIPCTFLVIQMQDSNTDKSAQITEAEPIVLVRNALEILQLSDVRVEWNGLANQVELEGYVETNLQRIQLLNEIESLGVNYQSHLRAMDTIRRGVKFILGNLGYQQVQVKNGDSAGTILLTGYIDDASRWSQVEKIIESDIPGLLAWKVELQRAGAYLDELKEMLRAVNLLSKLQLVKAADRIEARGELNEMESTTFYKVARDFREKFGDKPYLVLKSIPKVSKGANIDFIVRAANFGIVPYVVLADNNRYTQGTRTPSGYLIMRISEFGIDIAKGDQQITINFGGINDSVASQYDDIGSALARQ